MKNAAVEIEVVRGDIDLLRSMVDRALNERTGDDTYLRALSDVLYTRQKWITWLCRTSRTITRNRRRAASRAH